MPGRVQMVVVQMTKFSLLLSRWANPDPAAGVLGGLPQGAELLLVLFAQALGPGLVLLQTAGGLFVVGFCVS